jgi:hypothetical protein
MAIAGVVAADAIAWGAIGLPTPSHSRRNAPKQIAIREQLSAPTLGEFNRSRDTVTFQATVPTSKPGDRELIDIAAIGYNLRHARFSSNTCQLRLDGRTARGVDYAAFSCTGRDAKVTAVIPRQPSGTVRPIRALDATSSLVRDGKVTRGPLDSIVMFSGDRPLVPQVV